MVGKSIEGRVLTGTVMFVAIMILIGWVAINEEARMQSFVRQHTGRAIERGAELYASLCAECHGEEGYGQGDRAPGLNNPHLFGFDPVGEYTAAISNATRALVRLNDETDSLLAELTESVDLPSVERQNEILSRIDELELEIDAQQAAIEEAIAARADTLSVLDPAVENGLYPQWESVTDIDTTAVNEVEAFFSINGTRLTQVGWAGGVHDYVVTTLVHGRPGSVNVWLNSEGMAAWSQTAGGPLRDDQIEDLTQYVLNWDKGGAWTIEDFIAVQQYGKPLADGSLPSEPPPPPVGDDPLKILANLEAEAIEGSEASGELLYDAEFGCTDCHRNGASAPDTVGTWTRVLTERLAEPQFAGYSAEQYVVESIVRPGDYVVEGYNSGLMPSNFGVRMTAQQLADIIAFIMTQE